MDIELIWGLPVAYIFSIIFGNYFISNIVKNIQKYRVIDYKITDMPDKTQKYGILPLIVGGLEAFMYTTICIIGQYQFIGVWFLFKVACRWKIVTPQGISEYYSYLIGSSLSLIWSVGGGMIYNYLKCDMKCHAFIIGSAILIGSEIILVSICLNCVKVKTIDLVKEPYMG